MEARLSQKPNSTEEAKLIEGLFFMPSQPKFTTWKSSCIIRIARTEAWGTCEVKFSINKRADGRPGTLVTISGAADALAFWIIQISVGKLSSLHSGRLRHIWIKDVGKFSFSLSYLPCSPLLRLWTFQPNRVRLLAVFQNTHFGVQVFAHTISALSGSFRALYTTSLSPSQLHLPKSHCSPK